jgi:RNA polymerase sigma-70 factor (sigma-E family)
MESDAAVHPGRPARTAAADAAVTALYQAHALGLIRLAYLMLGDTAAAEDVVQEAFTGLYRRWAHLSDPAKALPYVRSSILNACRTQLRRLGQPPPGAGQAQPPPAISAEAAALSGEDRRAVLSALRRLPDRQREVLVLRYYLDLPEPEIAAAMGIGPSTVRSTAHRALTALGRMLEEQS